MIVTSAKNVKIGNVAPGVGFARNLTLFEARRMFGARMFNAKEIQGFSLKHPDAFLRIVRETSLHSETLSVISDAPLGSFMQNGKLVVQAESNDEKRQLIIPEKTIIKAGVDLEQEKPFLLINGGYKLNPEGSAAFTVTVNQTYNDTFGKFLVLLTKPDSDGWYGEIAGVAAGKASDGSKTDDLYHYLVSQFGSVRRGVNLVGYNYGRSVDVGNGFADSRGVLLKIAEGTKVGKAKTPETQQKLVVATPEMVKAVETAQKKIAKLETTLAKTTDTISKAIAELRASIEGISAKLQ